MAEQLCFEDVEVGDEIPPMEKPDLTYKQIVWFTVASRDDFPIHYDEGYAKSLGYPTILGHGPLKNAYLYQYLNRWIGTKGWVKSISVEMRGMDHPGDKCVAKGQVTKKYIADGEHLVECNVWLENQRGITTPNTSAIVRLPSRSPKTKGM